MKIAVHGLGRIGRAVVRRYLAEPRDFQLVAASDRAPVDQVAHLLQYDSAHGRLAQRVGYEQTSCGGRLEYDGHSIVYLEQADSRHPNWNDLDVDLVLDCTGAIDSRDAAEEHIRSGAKAVLLSHPLARGCDATVVFGFNHQNLVGTEQVISNASCTSNALVPILDCLQRTYGIVSGSSSTIHSAMNDQPVNDAYANNLCHARAAGSSVIPVETGLAAGIHRFFPHLRGRFVSTAVRVPTLNVSALDVVLHLERPVTHEDILGLFREQLPDNYRGIVRCCMEPLVSVDFNGDTASSVVDATQIRIFEEGHMLKLWLWFDNEWGFASRMLDVSGHLAQYHQGKKARAPFHAQVLPS